MGIIYGEDALKKVVGAEIKEIESIQRITEGFDELRIHFNCGMLVIKRRSMSLEVRYEFLSDDEEE